MRIRDLIREEGYDTQRDADAVSGKPRKTSIGGGKKPKGYSKDKAEKAAVDNVKKVLAKEEATAGATSAGAIATVANPAHAYGDIPRDKNGIPKKKSKKKSDGTVVNALDANDSFFGGKIAKR